MSIKTLTKESLPSSYDALQVMDVQDLEALKRIGKVVHSWCTKAFNTAVELSDALQDYRTIVTSCSDTINCYILNKKIPKKERLLAAYDKDANLQGVAVIEFKKSAKHKTPFIRIGLLLTAFWNTAFQVPASPKCVKGAGSALLALAAKLTEKIKCLQLDALESAIPFYEKIGFVLCNRQSYAGDTYKLVSADFATFTAKWASQASVTKDKAPDIRDDVSDASDYVVEEEKEEYDKNV